MGVAHPDMLGCGGIAHILEPQGSHTKRNEVVLVKKGVSKGSVVIRLVISKLLAPALGFEGPH